MIIGEVKSGHIWIVEEDVDEDALVDGAPISNVIVQSKPPWFATAESTRGASASWQALSLCVHGENLKGQGVATSVHRKSDKRGDAWYDVQA